MNAEQHKRAIEAAVKAAENDGYILSVDNPCGGCCSSFEVALYKAERNKDGNWVYPEYVEVNL